MDGERCNMIRNNGLVGRLLVSAALSLGCASCAVQGGPEAGLPAAEGPPPAQGTAARMGLAPGLRPFYDELKDEGDWILVEPHGWVFRPRVNTVAWRPYQDGHWEPSYAFAWVWESHDPFGWITDHYGFWFHDDFQGWLWQPYGAWAPSWVAWVQVGNFVGWAPLPPADTPGYGDVPGGVFTYMPRQSLASPSAGASASYVRTLPDDGSPLQPITNNTSYMGAYYNTGPPLSDVLGVAATDQLKADEHDGRVPVPVPTRKPHTTGQAPALALPTLEA